MPRRPHVAIVEDDPDTLLMLRLNLEAVGFDTSLAADGGTAIRRIENERPDVVLLDLMLPVMDGWTVLGELKSWTDAPPVVVCSAKGSARDIARAHEMGAAEYIVKPFDVDDLIATLRDVVASHPLPGRGPIAEILLIGEMRPEPIGPQSVGPA
jgi:two-component system response regulator ResD